jgi:hypothetical protein
MAAYGEVLMAAASIGRAGRQSTACGSLSLGDRRTDITPGSQQPTPVGATRIGVCNPPAWDAWARATTVATPLGMADNRLHGQARANGEKGVRCSEASR